MKDETLNKLNKTLEGIEEKLSKQNSVGRNFIRGAVYGFGFLLGTTILASLVLTIIGVFVDVVPFMQSFFGIEPETLKKALEQ